jgi:hypothetical protein
MSGRRKDSLISEYIAAIEDGAFVVPKIDFMYKEHKYARIEDVYSGGRGHTPDSIVAGAMAWSMREQAMRGPLPAIISMGGQQSYWSGTDAQPVESGWRM